MSPVETFRAALVIGRRDFTATVMSKAFLLFLLGPLFPILIGLTFGNLGAQVATDAEQVRVAYVGSAEDYRRLQQARSDFAAGARGAPIVRFMHAEPDHDPPTQAERMLAAENAPVIAILTGPLDAPQLTGQLTERNPLTAQIRLLLIQARQGADPPKLTVRNTARGTGNAAAAVLGQASQALLGLLTLLLAGMLLSQFIEEKSNKVIEVLAAAVPVPAVFLGKLFAMLCVSLVGIAVWAAAAIAALAALAAPGALSAMPPPAVGWPLYILLTIVYFAVGYLLIGAAFLGIGAQASTVRQVQTLSMPITMAQVMIFAFAMFASRSGGTAQLTAALIPLTSPYAMLAQAAVDPRLWPHLLAILWQGLWVATLLAIAAALFRRSVLKSGGPGLFRRRARA